MNIGELRTVCCCVLCADTNCAVHVLCGVLLCMKIVTVNCARIIHGNQVATNGVVHIIDRVITAVGNTIQDVIEVDDDLTTLSVSLLFSLCPFLPFLFYLSFPTFPFLPFSSISFLLFSPFLFSSRLFHSILFDLSIHTVLMEHMMEDMMCFLPTGSGSGLRPAGQAGTTRPVHPVRPHQRCLRQAGLRRASTTDG